VTHLRPQIATVARNFCVVLAKLSAGSASLTGRVIAAHRTLGTARMVRALVVLDCVSRDCPCRHKPLYVVPVIFTATGSSSGSNTSACPLYSRLHHTPHADVEMILVVDGLTVICLTLAVNFLTRKIPAFPAVILGTVITSLSLAYPRVSPNYSGAQSPHYSSLR